MDGCQEPIVYRGSPLQAEEISSKYQVLWLEQKHDPKSYFLKVRDEFNQSGRPELFLYLLARCVKGSVRYNSRGEFNQSADNRRQGMKPETMRDPDNYRLLSGSANRAKPRSCGHCVNRLDLRNSQIYRRCYWAYPEDYDHIAMRQARRVDILWSGEEITVYERLKARTLELQKELPAYVKEILERHLQTNPLEERHE
jgi:D12 class N6 adenine-specific DNA methyltransferase